MKRLGLFLAILAVVFTTTILPWHTHKGASSAQSEHCTVCHFSKEVRSASPSALSAVSLPFDDGIVIASSSRKIPSVKALFTASPRAPPIA